MVKRVAEALVAGNSWINAHNLFPHGVPYAFERTTAWLLQMNSEERIELRRVLLELDELG